MLHLESLPPRTASLFNCIASIGRDGLPFDLASRLFLAGGTALSLQIGHRMSNDLDFACADDRLPTFAIDQFIELLKKSHGAQLITPFAQISTFKIQTGLNLLDYARDYSIDQAKVTFFVIGKTEKQKAFYQKTEKITNQWTFPLLGLEGLKLAKTLALAERVRSRDLIDLMYLMRDHGYSLPEFNRYVETFGTNNDIEFYKAVMTGAIPLDADDEAYALLNASVELADMYEFFQEKINAYEVDLARTVFSSKKQE